MAALELGIPDAVFTAVENALKDAFGEGTTINAVEKIAKFPGYIDYDDNMKKVLNGTFLGTLAAVLKRVAFTDVASFLNNWQNGAGSAYFAPGHRVNHFGTVEIRGRARSPAAGAVSNTAIFQLPAGQCPAKDMEFVVKAGTQFGTVLVKADGNVVATTGPTTNNIDWVLDGIQFDAA